MPQVREFYENVSVSEMEIVDTITKLIFGEEEGYSSRELAIIGAFPLVDVNLIRSTHRETGKYLHSLGVGEMIQLVTRLREHLQGDSPDMSSASSRLSPTSDRPVVTAHRPH